MFRSSDLRQMILNKILQINILFMIRFITFEPLKMGGGGGGIKMVVIPNHFMIYLCSTPWIKA